MGEMDRVMFANKETVKTNKEEEEKKTHNNDFLRLQEQLYFKFNNAELNKRQVPIKIETSPIFTKRNAKLDLYESHLELTSATQRTGTRTSSRNLGSPLNSQELIFKTEPDSERVETQAYSENIHTRRRKKHPKKPLGKPSSDTPKIIETDRYFKTDPDTVIASMQITEEEGKKSVQQLNKNIKLQRTKTLSSIIGATSPQTTRSTAATNDFVDVDTFFTNQIEHRLATKEDLKTKPQDFARYSSRPSPLKTQSYSLES